MSKLFVANWKMHKTTAEAQQFGRLLLQSPFPSDHTAVICSPFTALATLQSTLAASPIQWGAQTMHWEHHGAYTGEISAPMLVDLGCTYVIIGHSERRRDANETNTTVNKKVLAAVQHKLIPIICVGESFTQRQANDTETVIRQQVTAALANVDLTQPIVIAYEPIWAIGTGVTATPDQAETVHALIRTLATPQTPIIYGGSVTPENSSALMAQTNIDGALIGGASLEVESFQAILNYQ